jgi:hypothetical protein
MKTKNWVTLIVILALIAGCGIGAVVTNSEWDFRSGLTWPSSAPASTPEETAEAVPEAPVEVEENPVMEQSDTWKFDYPDAGLLLADGWSVDGLPAKVDPATVLVTSGVFKNTIPGTESWLAEPGTKLVGPDYPADKMKAEGGTTEYISPINQELIDESGEYFHVNEDRIDLCSFGAATLEVNGVRMVFEYQPGHDWFLVIRGLFPDGLQDSDRNHTIVFTDVVGSHAQCMSYPANGGGFISENGFKQVAELSHKNHMNCGAEGCSGLTAVFMDLNTGALSVINQVQLGQPWTFVFSNWLAP